MWRKIVVVLVLLAAGIGVVLAIGWSRVRSVPGWYETAERSAGVEAEAAPAERQRGPERSGRIEPVPDPAPVPAPEQGRPAPRPGPARAEAGAQPEAWLEVLRREGRVSLGGEELRQLTVTALARTPDGREFMRVNRSIRGRVTGGFLEVGGVFDMAALDLEALTPETRETLASIRRLAPGLLGGELYLGVRGTPVAVDGVLGLAPGATMRIGEASLPLELLVRAARSAGSEDASRGADGPTAGTADDPTTLALPGLHVSHAEVVGDRVVIEAEPVTDR